MDKRLLSSKEIKDRWKNKVWEEQDRFDLYIDNPFCVRHCSFCIHGIPEEIRINSEPYRKYYLDYLPKMFDMFQDILTTHSLDAVYFGGGTASLMSAHIMKNIFSQIPGFKDIPGKSFENHPVFTTPEKIQLFAENNFRYLSFGIQTMNQELLKKLNRIPHNEQKLGEILSQAMNLGMGVNTDLMVFLEDDVPYDLKRFDSDLRRVAGEYHPSFITIYPRYGKLVEAGKDNAVSLLVELRKILLKFQRHFPEYWIINKNCLSLDREIIQSNILGDYVFVRVSPEECNQIRKYNSTSFPAQPPYQNVIGLGGYGRREPYSYHGRSFYYQTQNDNWQPRFFEVIDTETDMYNLLKR